MALPSKTPHVHKDPPHPCDFKFISMTKATEDARVSEAKALTKRDNGLESAGALAHAGPAIKHRAGESGHTRHATIDFNYDSPSAGAEP